MDMKPGFKQSEVGPIPNDWAVSAVGDEFSIQLGKMLDSEKNVGVPKPYLGNRAVQWGRIDLSDLGVVKLTPTDIQRFRLRDGDILACEGGEVGRAAIWRQPLDECYYQKALHRLRPKNGYNVQLMVNVLQRLASNGFLLNFVTQTSIAHLPKDKFETVPIPVPTSKVEQEAIATALSDADALIESLEKLLAKKRQIKQGAMQELLTGKRRLPGFATKGSFIQTEVGLIPEDWEVKPLAALARLYQPVTISAKQFTESGLPVYGANGFVGFYSQSNHESWQVIVTCRGSTCGTVNRTVDRCWITGNAMVLNCDENRALSKEFFYYLLCGQDLSGCITGTGQPQIVRSPLAGFHVPLPPTKAEQEGIAATLSDMDTEITTLEAKLTKARDIKQGMMQELLTGRIRLV